MARDLYKFFTETAKKASPSWGARDLARFHMWNPNGIVAEWHAKNEKVRELVESGRVKSGWYIAHGSMDDFGYKMLCEIISQQNEGKRIKKSEVELAYSSILHSIMSAEQAIRNLED